MTTGGHYSETIDLLKSKGYRQKVTLNPKFKHTDPERTSQVMKEVMDIEDEVKIAPGPDQTRFERSVPHRPQTSIGDHRRIASLTIM